MPFGAHITTFAARNVNPVDYLTSTPEQTKPKIMLRPFLLGLVLLLLSAGCSKSVMRSMVGVQNINSVDYAARCEVDSALTMARESRQHNSLVTQSQGLLLEVVYLMDMNRTDEAKAIYPIIMKRSLWIKTEKQVDKAVKQATRDLQKKRKRRGYPKTCDLATEE